MPSVSGDGASPVRDAPVYFEHLRSDLKFFQLFLVLVNKSCPIKRVDVLWNEDGPAGRIGLGPKAVCTQEALAGPCARMLQCSNAFEPVFCNLVADHGRREAETCEISDAEAARRVGRSGQPEVYRCHAGLIDIAVPVFSEGQHLATLLTGQVLREPPSGKEFARIRQSLAGLAYIDFDALEQAYWKIPVVSEADIANTIEVLQVCAEYLSTMWKRLSEAVRDQEAKSRELQLGRKEFAHLVLEGGALDRAALGELMKKIGFTRYPNRVMVVRFESEEDYRTPSNSFDVAFTSALQAIEEVCDRVPNVSCAYLRRRGVCIFYRDREEAPSGLPSGYRSEALANRVLHAIAARCDLHIRIGIGGAKSDWQYLLDSYHEAGIALGSGAGQIAAYQRPPAPVEELSAMVGRICRNLSDRRFEEASADLMRLPLEANAQLGDRAEHLGAQRQFFAYALASMAYAARQVGSNGVAAGKQPPDFDGLLAAAASVFELQEAFRRAAEGLLDDVRGLYRGKKEKLIERVQSRIERELQNPATAQAVSIPSIAGDLGVSAGHLSRIFKAATGMTLERYIMLARTEAAKRMLLDPLDNISGIAARCGFSDPTYFAKVFRKIAGCTPSEYRDNPVRVAQTQEPGAPAAPDFPTSRCPRTR